MAAPDSERKFWALYRTPSSVIVHWQRTLPWRSSFLITVPTGGNRDAAAWFSWRSASGAAVGFLAPRTFVVFACAARDVFLAVWAFFVCFVDMILPLARELTPGSVRAARGRRTPADRRCC